MRLLLVLGIGLTTLALAAGCGGGSRDGAEPPDGGPPTETPPPTEADGTTGENGTTEKNGTVDENGTTGENGTEPPGDRVGRVETVVRPEVLIGDRAVNNPTDLFERDSVATDEDGQLSFALRAKGAVCDTFPSSALQVHPGGGLLVRFSLGRSFCATQPGGAQAAFGVGEELEIRVSDPIFGVTVEEAQTIVKVTLGFVELASTTDETTLLLGPGQQAVVIDGQIPESAGPVDLADDEQASVGRLTGLVPIPELERPDPGASPALAAIFERGTMLVVLVEERIADAGTGPFVQGFGELLAGAWDLSIDLPAVPFEDASIAFAAGQVDAVIAPEDAAALLEGQALPLFDDSVGTAWQLVLPPDEGFVRAVEDFLGAILLRGDYGSIYEQSFGVTPSYERLEPLISP